MLLVDGLCVYVSNVLVKVNFWTISLIYSAETLPFHFPPRFTIKEFKSPVKGNAHHSLLTFIQSSWLISVTITQRWPQYSFMYQKVPHLALSQFCPRSASVCCASEHHEGTHMISWIDSFSQVHNLGPSLQFTWHELVFNYEIISTFFSGDDGFWKVHNYNNVVMKSLESSAMAFTLNFRYRWASRRGTYK